MTRSLSAKQNTYLAGDSLISVVLLDITMPDASVTRYTDAPFNITFNSNSYTAQGEFLSISETEENADLQIVSVTLQISALTLANVTAFAVSDIINQPVTVRRAFLNLTNNQLIGDSAGDNAVIIFKGRISGYQVANQENTATISLEISSQFINFDKKAGRRTNIGSMQIEHPDDFSMEFSATTLKDIKWGKA
jgi:hypothetical protein